MFDDSAISGGDISMLVSTSGLSSLWKYTPWLAADHWSAICQFCRYSGTPHIFGLAQRHKMNQQVFYHQNHPPTWGDVRIQDDRLYHFEKWNLLNPPPPISGTKTSRKLLILKLFPTPFKLMGSRNHRLMFAQFYMSFYHKNPKMNSWNPNSWRFCFRWFSFSGPFFRFHAVHVPCLQPAPPFAHLDDLSDMLWWPQRCPGGFQVPGLPVVFFNKNKHLQKQINYILDLPEKKVKYVCPFFWYRFFFVGWNFGTIFYTLGSRSRYVQKHGKAWTLSFPTFGLQVAFLPFAAPQHRTSGAKASENELPSGLVEKKILQSS